MRGGHSRFTPLGVFLLCLFLTACFGGKGGGGGGGGNGGGGGGGQQVFIGIQGVLPSNFVTGGTGTFTVQVANMGGKDSTSTTTLTADLGNAFTIAAGSGGGSGSWNCGASVGAQVNCAFTASILAHSTAPSLTINVNVSSTVSGSGQITFNVANPDGVVGTGASWTTSFTISGSGGGGGGGGMVTITTPEPLISFPELVVAGTANARTTAILQANVVSGDNGAGIDWYVCVGSLTSTTGCGGANVLGGNNVLGTISSGGHSASGAYVTYTAPATLPAQPDNNFVIITAQQPGTMGAAAGPPSATTVVPYIVQTNNEIPSGNLTEGANFVFRLRGFTSSGGLAYGIIGRFHVDGAGGVTKGVEDINIAQADGTSVVYTEVPFTGTYNMVNSSNGTMNLTVTSPAPWTIAPIPANPPPSAMTFAFTLDDQAATGKMIEAEPTGNYVGSGILQYQNPLTVFNSTGVSGGYAFSLATPTGTGSSGVHHGVIGRLDLVTGSSSTIGTVANTSTADDDSGNPTQNLTGTYVLDGPTADHGTLTLTSASNTSHSTFYVVNKRHIFALGSDPDTLANNRGVLLGDAIRIAANASGQQDTFNNTSLTGPFVFTALGETTSAAANGQGHASAMIGRFSGTAGAAGAGTFAGIYDINDGGTVLGPLNILGAGGSGPGDFTIGTDGRGRGVLNIVSIASGAPVTYHFVFYFVSPGFGFLQEQPASDGSRRGRAGEFLFQTVTAPIALPPINLTFEGGTTADTAASLHSVAVFQVNGAASPVSFTEMADTSKSVVSSQVPAATGTGTINVGDQTTGRGTVTATTVGAIAGSTGAVIYVEDPAEWLLMGTDATLQEPQIITMDQ
jgi:hypothetical protein